MRMTTDRVADSMPAMSRTDVTRVIERPRDREIDEPMPRREWLVTNGLGGYASSNVASVVTRRYHGLLVASLPAPLGRMVMLNHLLEQFRLELGLPVWTYEIDGVVIEKRVLMPHCHNTVHVTYRLLAGKGPVRLSL